METSHVVHEPPKDYPYKSIMTQVINGEPTEVVRWGSILLPKDHPLIGQIVGQMALRIPE